MYSFREVHLKNKAHEKTVLVMDFHDAQMAIVTEFFNESNIFLQEVLTKMELLKKRTLAEVEVSGNRCHLVMNERYTKISDLFEDLFEDTSTYPQYQLKTAHLQQFIHAYLNKQAELIKKTE